WRRCTPRTPRRDWPPRGCSSPRGGTIRSNNAPRWVPARTSGSSRSPRSAARSVAGSPELPGIRLACSHHPKTAERRPIVIKSFLVGAIAGGAMMWLYGDRIRDYVDDVTLDVRERAAAGLEGAAERLQNVADTV